MPKPYLFSWKTIIGPLVEYGDGLLSKHIFNNKHLIDTFIIFLGDWTLTIKPKIGEILFDSRLMYKLKEPGFLVWSRTMEKNISTYDRSDLVAYLYCYNFGLENKKEQCLYRLFTNGKAIEIKGHKNV